MLEKRRLVRALEVFRGSLLNKSVSVGTEKHPEWLDPPEPEVPSLDVLLAFVLAYGTGPSVDPDGDEYDGYGPADLSELRVLLENSRDASRTRNRLWNRVREPIARALQPFSGMTLDAVQERADTAAAVTAACGLDWERDFASPAVAAHPDLAAALLEASEGRESCDRVIPKGSFPRHETFTADLKAAMIPKVDEQGRTVDLHALRGTMVTWLKDAGVHPAVAQRAARHAKVDTTIRHYTHVVDEEVRAALAKVPLVPPVGEDDDE